jgi:hypothetical protein
MLFVVCGVVDSTDAHSTTCRCSRGSNGSSENTRRRCSRRAQCNELSAFSHSPSMPFGLVLLYMRRDNANMVSITCSTFHATWICPLMQLERPCHLAVMGNPYIFLSFLGFLHSMYAGRDLLQGQRASKHQWKDDKYQ